MRGRWNHIDVPALYFGLTPAICALETFVHATTLPDYPLKIVQVQLPQLLDLYYHPDPLLLPAGWDSKPADRSSMDYGTQWLRGGTHFGLIIPSAILPLENNIVVNPRHPAAKRIRILEVLDFSYDPRMFSQRS
ncbi:MAG: RES family NAD+ phosphorylase [Enterobacteriaceae bacterium]